MMRLSVSTATIFLQKLCNLFLISDPLFSLLGFRPRPPPVTEDPFKGIDPAVLMALMNKFKREEPGNMGQDLDTFSSEDSLEEDVDLALYDAGVQFNRHFEIWAQKWAPNWAKFWAKFSTRALQV